MSKDKARICLLEILIIVLLVACTLSGLIKNKLFTAGLATIIAISLSYLLQRKPILKVNRKKIRIIMIIFGILYIALFYTVGIYTGFYHQTYKLGLKTLLNYIIPITIIIVSTEQIRSKLLLNESILSKSLIVIITTIIDSSLYLNAYGFSNLDSFLGLIGFVVFSSIANNILFNYMNPKYGKEPIIIYKCITSLYIYFLPIAPDVYIYFRAFVRMIYPLLIYGYVERYMNLDKEIERKKDIKREITSYGIGTVIVLIVIALISCKFTYGILVIGSESMTGSIDKGDLIVFRNKKEPLNVGDVIVFQKEEIRVVHRIIDIKNVNDEFRYYTKGDANPTPDDNYITDDYLAGKVLFRIRYVGRPTLWLRSLFSKEG